MSSKLHAKGVILGYRRSRHKQYPGTSLVKIEGVRTKEDADWYVGKRVVYVYRAEKARTNRAGKKTHIRTVHGRITKPHGNSGTVRARFQKTPPPKAFGASVRVMLYPSRI